MILAQDAFTRYFDTEVLADLIEVFSRLGVQVLLAPFLPNGKPLQVLGFLGAFEQAAHKNAAMLGALSGHGVQLVGLNPAMTLVYRQEYRKRLGDAAPEVLLPQEWLAQHLELLDVSVANPGADYHLLGHCTENTNAPAATALWA